MTEIPFHATRAGDQLLRRDIPNLVRQLEVLNENLVALTRAVGALADERHFPELPEPDTIEEEL